MRRLVFSSSREVYGEPESIPVRESAPLTAKNPYGASKIAGEAYCQVWESTTGLECQILRFANVYGPRDRDRVIPIWLERASRGEPLELYGGEQVIDFVWVGKAVEALLAAAGIEPTGPINVGSGMGSTLPYLAHRDTRRDRQPFQAGDLPGSRCRSCPLRRGHRADAEGSPCDAERRPSRAPRRLHWRIRARPRRRRQWTR